jgi:DNA-binding response OmpR family regulator
MRRPLRVAVIDDNRDIVDTMTELLKAEGHDTRACYTGTDAFACVKAYDPDAVLLDIGLPGVSGWEVARQIRVAGTGEPPHRPLIIGITGEYTKSADRILSRMNGFDYYLIKPADPKVLLALLEKIKPSQ